MRRMEVSEGHALSETTNSSKLSGRHSTECILEMAYPLAVHSQRSIRSSSKPRSRTMATSFAIAKDAGLAFPKNALFENPRIQMPYVSFEIVQAAILGCR